MRLGEVFEFTDEVKPNSFSSDIKTEWINELESRVQIEIMAMDIIHVRDYVWASTLKCTGVYFPNEHTIILPKRANVRAGGALTITGLSRYSDNNGEYEVESVSEDGKCIRIADDLSVTGETPETSEASIAFSGSECELLVPKPFCKLYYSYLLLKISEYLEEAAEQNNRRQTFESDFVQFSTWYAKKGWKDEIR